MRSITEQGLQLIKQFEKFVSSIYVCPAGYPTIGYGHVVSKHERDKFQGGIDHTTAVELLKKDVKAAEQAVLALIHAPLTDGQFAALTSFTYNVGSGALQRSVLRQVANRSDHDSMPHEFAKWVYVHGKKLRGLVIRRAMEAALYANG